MKQLLLILILAALALTSCHESLEQRAEREAREYTEKFCPTPYMNFTRTDSVTFDIETKTYHYYCSVNEQMDDPAIIDLNKNNLHDGLVKALTENTSVKVYKEAGFNFAYTLHSAKNPSQELYHVVITPKDYNGKAQ